MCLYLSCYSSSHCRREMMPLLSLIFSALFILFGTVIIQAFRYDTVGLQFRHHFEFSLIET